MVLEMAAAQVLECSGNGPFQVRVPGQAVCVVALHLLKEGSSNATGSTLAKGRVILLSMGWKKRLIKGGEFYFIFFRYLNKAWNRKKYCLK